MKVTILFFAQLRDSFGKREENINIQKGTTISKLLDTLFQMAPAKKFKSLPLLYAVNEELVKKDSILSENDVLALIPPVAGG